MGSRLGDHAVVVGGSIAGLLTARVLADFFEQVTILERDHIETRPGVHKSTPQGHHLHTMLTGGLRILEDLHPGFSAKLQALGAVPVHLTRDFPIFHPEGVAYSLTGTVKEPRDLGIRLYSQSRGLLEHCLRECTMMQSNVSAECDAQVSKLNYSNGRVDGVSYRYSGEPRVLKADLVVDCGGRGSHAPTWLAEMGFTAPEETVLGVDFAYSSTRFHLPNYNGELGRYPLFGGPPPNYTRGGGLAQIENGMWQLSLAGRFGDYPPTDEAEFMAFAKALPSPRLYELLNGAERVDEIRQFRFPTSLLRHYERLPSFPERFIVLGDAISSFNPVYGQGMSSAALQVNALRQLLDQRSSSPEGLSSLAAAFFPRAAEMIYLPWTLASNFDFAFPQTTGTRLPVAKEMVSYFATLDALTVEDVEVQKLLAEVFGLARPLLSLWDEPVRSRVFERMHQTNGTA